MSFRVKTILGIAFIEIVMLVALTFSAMSFCLSQTKSNYFNVPTLRQTCLPMQLKTQ